MTRPKVPLLRYGGKVQLAKRIIEHFPPHRIYAEPFGGSLAVLFAKDPAEIEAVNDLDARLVNVWRQIRERPQELAALLWATPYCQADFDAARRARKEPLAHDADLLEAARQEILFSKQCYVGAPGSSTWAYAGEVAHARLTPWLNWCKRILPAADRLRDVVVHQEDAVQFCARYADNPDALIYVDPPYVGHESEYELRVSYDALVAALAPAKAWVVVSEYEEGAARWPAEWTRVVLDAPRRGGSERAGASRKREYLICNWVDE